MLGAPACCSMFFFLPTLYAPALVTVCACLTLSGAVCCSPFQACRYHSLVIEKDSCPEDLEVTAWTEDGTIMAVRHKIYPHIQGVQFHPESIITQSGKKIVGNFVASLHEMAA